MPSESAWHFLVSTLHKMLCQETKRKESGGFEKGWGTDGHIYRDCDLQIKLRVVGSTCQLFENLVLCATIRYRSVMSNRLALKETSSSSSCTLSLKKSCLARHRKCSLTLFFVLENLQRRQA